MYNSIVKYCIDYPYKVLILTFFLLLVVIPALLSIEIKTSNLDLIDNDNPEVVNFLNFAESFGTPNSLVVVFENGDEKDRIKAVEISGPILREIKGVRKVLDRAPSGSPFEMSVSSSFFKTRGGEAYFLYIQPDNARSELNTIIPLLGEIRSKLELALSNLNIKIGYTGIPQYALDDQTLIRNHLSLVSLLSLVLVVMIFLIGFHSLRAPLFATFSLIISLIFSFGFVKIYPSYLTLLSSPFIMLIIGLGIDYGIHIVSLKEELARRFNLSERDALLRAVLELKRTLLSSCVTTAGVFFILYFTDFQAFRELSIIAGVAMLLCLVMMITLLPALISRFPVGVSSHLPEENNLSFINRGIAIGKVVAPVLLLLSVLSLFSFSPKFDSNYLNLQPKNSDAVRLERMIVSNSRFSPYFVGFKLGSIKEVKDLKLLLKKEPTVGDIRSVEDILRIFNGTVPKEFEGIFSDSEGNYAVLAFPSKDIWNDEFQAEFLSRMKTLHSSATGLPYIGSLMIQKTKEALEKTEIFALCLIFFVVYLDFRSLIWTFVVIIPPIFSVLLLKSTMILLGLSFNPLNIMSIPIVLGTAIDNSIHIAHRYRVERGNLGLTLSGCSRSIVLTWLTTLAGFGGLMFTTHEGLKSFGVLLSVGITLGFLLSMFLLPCLLALVNRYYPCFILCGNEEKNTENL